MASRWFYRVFDQELGPLGFQDLAEMVGAGTLTEDDRVRREFSDKWIAAREVIGLFRAAQGPAAETKPPEPESAPSAPEPKPRSPEAATAPPTARPRRWRIPRIGLRVGIAAAIVLVVGAIVAYEFWSHRRSRIFPESALKRPRPADRESLVTVLGPRPKVPSIPDLKEGVAKPIPGLEEVEPGLSPCLTPDLKTIVYAAMTDAATDYDLYIATRDDVSKPFGPSKLIQGCQSPQSDAYPTLSADGLELIFKRSLKRSEGAPQFYRTTRDSTSSEFNAPVHWPVPGYDVRKQGIALPQLLDRTHIKFIFADAPKARKTMICERSDPKSPFGPPRESTMYFNGWLPWFVATSGLRLYFGTPDGLFVVSRQNLNQSFGQEVRVLAASATGPIEGPLWVAPQEDVVFYVSPGPGKKPGLGPGDKGRKLWMLRF